MGVSTVGYTYVNYVSIRLLVAKGYKGACFVSSYLIRNLRFYLVLLIASITRLTIPAFSTSQRTIMASDQRVKFFFQFLN